MGFFSSVGKGITKFTKGVGENLFGTETTKEAARSASQSAAKMSAVGDQAKAFGQQYAKQGTAYDTGTAQSMGSNAADYMKLAQASAEQQAEAAGQTAATQGTQAALRAARSSGLSKGQAALAGAQQTGDIYTNTYGQQLQQGISNYGNATSQFASQGNEMATRQQNALNTQLGAATGQANVAQNQTQNAANKSAQTWGTVGTVAGAGALLLSDETTKTNITGTGDALVDKTKNAAKEAVNKTNFDKDKLSGMLSGLGKTSSVSAAPVSTSGVNAAQDTTAASRDQLSKGILTTAGAIKSKMDENKPDTTVTPATKSDTPSSGFSLSGLTSMLGKVGGMSGGAGAAGGAGGVAAGGAGGLSSLGSLAALSDERSKMSIEDLKNKVNSFDIDEVAKKIRPVKFEYKPEIVAEGKAEGGEHVGVLAQDVEKALPGIVKEGPDGLKRIDTTELSPALLNLIVQLAKKVDKIQEGEK